MGDAVTIEGLEDEGKGLFIPETIDWEALEREAVFGSTENWKELESAEPLIQREIYCRFPEAFCYRAIREFKPIAFRWRYYHAVIMRLTLAAFRGECLNNRLVINIPPRCSKSTLISVLIPAFYWLQRPQHQYLFLSKNPTVSDRDAGFMRIVVGSEWYQGLIQHMHQSRGIPVWNLRTDSNKVGNYANTLGGHRISQTVESAVTGKDADAVLIDDPSDAKDAIGAPHHVEARFKRVADQFEGVWLNRLNNPSKGAHICIMQRLHTLDLSGYMLGRGCSHFVYPLLSEPDHPYRSRLDKRAPGESLDPVRFPPAIAARYMGAGDLESTKRWLFQYRLRDDIKTGDSPFREEWLKTYPEYPTTVLSRADQVWSSTDAASSDASTSSFCCIQVWARIGRFCYLIHQWHKQVLYPELHTAWVDIHKVFPGISAKLIENKSSGAALIQNLQASGYGGIIPINPTGDKLTRFMGIVPRFIAGEVLFPDPRFAPWMGSAPKPGAPSTGLIGELLQFPAKPNDRVDTLSQALSFHEMAGAVDKLDPVQEIRDTWDFFGVS